MIVYQAALHIVVLLIFVAGGLLTLGAYLLYKMLAAKTQIDSDYTKRPPAVLRTTGRGRLSLRRGNRQTAGAAAAGCGCGCDFHFGQGTRGDRRWPVQDGQDRRQRRRQGDLTPVSSGAEELRLHLEVGSKTGDETPIDFEVQKS